MRSEVFNIDCMGAMAGMVDNQFDLAIVDPPYGIGLAGYSTSPKRMFGKLVKCSGSNFAIKKWDSEKPSDAYFHELLRVSNNQIIWGGNYFTSSRVTS